MKSATMNKHIKTELPGPKARALLERDQAVVSPSYPRDYPFVMNHGKGAEVWDVDGNRFIDFAAGIAVCSTGHSHPQVVQAIQQAAEKFLHISSDYWHEGQVVLAETMNRLAPFGEPAMSFFCNSGTESVEGALKLARYVTGRPRFIGFLGGFHGRSMGSLSFTSSKYTQQMGFFPTMPGVTLVPYPNSYRPLFAGDDQGRAVLSYIEDTLFQSNVPAKEVAAVLIEPIQGEGGYLVPPPGFLKGLRELCDRHGILLIFDEVQSAIGRTGRMFASEHVGVTPDIITMAKGLGSGMPIGMVLAKRKIMSQWKRGAHGNTYGGNPLCCAAASATLKLVEEQYSANAAEQGAYIMDRLRAMQNKYPDLIGQVRGVGLMIGIEMITDRQSRKPATDFTNRLLDTAFHNGLLLLSCGVSTLRLMPPLMIDRAITDEALRLLDASISQTLNESQKPTGT
jgi:4-aminobutyrate aminotransferase